MSEWISTKTPPDVDSPCVVYFPERIGGGGYGSMSLAFFKADTKRFSWPGWRDDGQPTHWMPLPAPPEPE